MGTIPQRDGLKSDRRTRQFKTFLVGGCLESVRHGEEILDR